MTLADRAIRDATTNGTGVRSLSADGRSTITAAWFRLLDKYAAMEAARSFSESVELIPEVRAVVIDIDRREPLITTYVGKRDPAVRSRIYVVEDETHARFPLVHVDFRVLSLEGSSSFPTSEADAGVHVLFSRP
jgi:hypothetical protein